MSSLWATIISYNLCSLGVYFSAPSLPWWGRVGLAMFAALWTLIRYNKLNKRSMDTNRRKG